MAHRRQWLTTLTLKPRTSKRSVRLRCPRRAAALSGTRVERVTCTPGCVCRAGEIDSVRAENVAKRTKCWWPPTSILHPSCPFKIGWDVALMLLIL